MVVGSVWHGIWIPTVSLDRLIFGGESVVRWWQSGCGPAKSLILAVRVNADVDAGQLRRVAQYLAVESLVVSRQVPHLVNRHAWLVCHHWSAGLVLHRRVRSRLVGAKLAE